jgi:hypothetical protein
MLILYLIFSPESNWKKLALVVGAVVFAQFVSSIMAYKEISWKEFVSEFLEKGKVQRLEVVDKRWVRVVPYQDEAVRRIVSNLLISLFSAHLLLQHWRRRHI